MAGDKEQPKPVLEGETCIAGRPQTKTQFIDYSLKELKQMLDGVKPEPIEETGRHWGKVNEILVGGKDGEGIAGLLDKAVNNVLEHWEGEAARAFEKTARGIAQSIRNAAWHADLNSTQMADAARQLRNYKPQLDDIKEPSGWAKVGDALSDWKWDEGESTAKDLGDQKLTAKQVAEINEGKIGASREAHLNGVAVMESLGAQYMRVTGNLERNRIIKDPDGNIKEPNRDVEYPPPVTPGGVGGASRPGGAGSANKPWSAGPPKGIGAAPQVPRPKGITGGAPLPLPPSTGTNVDSIKPGLTGPGLGPGPGGGGGGGGGGNTGPGLVAPGGTQGGIRPAGGRGGISPVNGRGGRVGVPSGAGGTGRGGGRPGMGGMGGGAGAGAAGRGGAGAGGRGALAKARGGVVGAAKGIAGKGAGGGAGLHGSRGGTQRGGMPGGMAGGMGGRNGRRQGDENERGDRPDYLVEDEETWISEEDRNRNVPRNIE
ncbi:hypothetical protein J7I98_02665 [Streptomyces sp. ISL-98]|uniref:hypothetical protein n=1 Tax=Streptomyces sp. ISL-98 TaxID=2819192 RepID=UPI001BE7A7BE|nr:hypothetical protein [Streptomyces sp. ISL-98]MBT2504812.1 hypothetical protein [Streptomyces sp. ISL-98]